jgi:bifunctional non-homologous end joining protein LigD
MTPRRPKSTATPPAKAKAKAKPKAEAKAKPKVKPEAQAKAKAVPLEEYRKKRRFDVTSEPAGGKPAVRPPPKGKKLAFVVQKHRATALHYDLRLEWKGVMLSWAVPKGPSYDTSIKRLAMQVEDHPIEYNEFEGIIPEGEYGGGTVMIWDHGTWTPASPDVDEALKKGDLKFTFEGQKLRGSWVLIRTGRRPGQSKTSWILLKHRDQWTSTEDITELAPRSVVSNRLLVEIARDEGGDLRKAADGDPPAALKEILENPKLLAPPKTGRKRSVWHSNRGGGG